MAVKMVHETTILGDKYGKQVKQNGVVIQTATRTFTVEVDNAADRSINEVYALLPKKGESHPYIINIPACLVKSIDVAVTKDPHIYEATVEYSTEVDLNDGSDSEDDEEAPWNQLPNVSFSVDTSIVEPTEFAYLRWPHMQADVGLKALSLGEPAEGALQGSGAPDIPIVNLPMREKFKGVAEEPVKGLAITISFAYKASSVNGIIENDLIYKLYNEVLTVNNEPVAIAGYVIYAYQGYYSDASAELAFYRRTPKHRPVPYFNTRITIIENSKGWVRFIQNMSMNMISKDKDGVDCISPVQLISPESGLKEPIKEPTLIHPDTGEPITVTILGRPYLEDKRVFVLPFLTKKPSNWSQLRAILNTVISR